MHHRHHRNSNFVFVFIVTVVVKVVIVVIAIIRVIIILIILIVVEGFMTVGFVDAVVIVFGIFVFVVVVVASDSSRVWSGKVSDAVEDCLFSQFVLHWKKSKKELFHHFFDKSI